jgi:Calpain family cysteine protease
MLINGAFMSGSSNVPSWISTLGTATIAADMAAADVAGVVSATGLTKLLTDLDATLSATSTLTSAEFSDLQTIAANLNNGLSTSGYLSYVFNALVNGNAANATWTGGNAASVTLGNLAVGANATNLSELIGKWFLGTDLPSSTVNVASSTATVNLTGSSQFTVAYSQVNSPLFGAAGPSMNDINQGSLGDCYFLSSCAEIANQKSSIISSMFTNNGNGTYGVRMYANGVAQYVTVSLSLANSGGAFNHASDIWASLAEKAYAQFQAISLETGNSVNYGNSYSTIGNGGMAADALEALTGCSAFTDFEASGSTWTAYSQNASLTYTSKTPNETTASVLSAIQNALAAHDDVILRSNTNATDSSGAYTLVAAHDMSVYGYDSATGNLQIRNPWGATTFQYWDTTFEVSLSTLLAAGDLITIDNAGTMSGQTVLSGAISETAAYVSANIASLDADAAIISITLTDSGVPVLNLTPAQAATYTTALGEITNSVYEEIIGNPGQSALRTVAFGGGFSVTFGSVQGTAADLHNTNGAWDTVSGSNGVVSLSNAKASVFGGGNSVNLDGSAGNVASLYKTGANWDWVAGNNGAVNLYSSLSSVSGGGNNVELYGTGDVVSLYNTGPSWDWVGGSNSTINLYSSLSSVSGGGNNIELLGAGDAVSLYNTGANWDWVGGANSKVNLYSSFSSVSGGGNNVELLGAGDAVSLYNTGSSWDWVGGSNSTINLYSSLASVSGGGNNVELYGTGDAVSLYNTGSNWDWVGGSNSTVNVYSSLSSVSGGGNNIELYGSGDVVSIYNTGSNWDWVGGRGAVNFYGVDATLGASGDTATFAGSTNMATLSGGSDLLNFLSTFGLDTINGFTSSDTLQFSKSDFASWNALQSHMTQSGANTVIRLDANDTVTLTNFAASALQQSQVKFV